MSGGVSGGANGSVTGSLNKVVQMDEAIGSIEDGCRLMFGGFGGTGSPHGIIGSLLEKGVKSLSIVGNDTGFPDYGIGRLIAARRVRRAIVSHIGSNPRAIEQMNDGELEIEFVPQGTLAERIRAGGAGLGGILTDVGLETEVADGKERVWVDGREYLLETPLTADVAIVAAFTGDAHGNLVYRASAQNFNPLVAMAGRTVIAEVQQLVDVGDIPPEAVHTPGLFVDAVVVHAAVTPGPAAKGSVGGAARSGGGAA